MKGLFWFGIVLLVLVMIYSGFSTSCYAPPRDENTVPPYVEDFSSSKDVQDSQTEVFKDASGWLNQREHPMTDFFQANAFSGSDMGTFSSLESSAGRAEMTVIPYEEQYGYGGTVSQTVAGTTNCRKSVAVVTPKDPATFVCPVAKTANECVLGPGTYTIDEKSYSMDVYAPLYVKATAPSGVVQNMTYVGDECKPPQRLTLDARRGFNTLILSVSTDGAQQAS